MLCFVLYAWKLLVFCSVCLEITCIFFYMFCSVLYACPCSDPYRSRKRYIAV
ncbi:hypothetical protein M6B38_369715 [Iris pallida]|uniref:Uncharacterized protein n=1 Tax=Iris pallida TaxID=29817 RepID=A0AAX6GDW6_IRIPA|nr:hypothetical protein M6B38_369715 [Iris pallida]